jgi:hypothetical protein
VRLCPAATAVAATRPLAALPHLDQPLTLEDAARRAGMDAARLTAVEDAAADIDSYRMACIAEAFGVPQARLWERIERHVRRMR